MSVNVLLNLLNKLRKRARCKAAEHRIVFAHEVYHNKFNQNIGEKKNLFIASSWLNFARYLHN